MCRQPSTPMPPPMTVASVQNATATAPATVPRAATTPEVSRPTSSRIEPSSKNRSSRCSGSRGSGAATTGGAVWTAVTWPPGLRGGAGGGAPVLGRREHQRGVVTAEAEGVVHRRGEVSLAGLGAHDVEGLDGRVVVGVVEVGRRRHDLVAQREDGEDRLQGPGGA